MFRAAIDGKLICTPFPATNDDGELRTAADVSVHAGEESMTIRLLAIGVLGRRLAELHNGDWLIVKGTIVPTPTGLRLWADRIKLTSSSRLLTGLRRSMRLDYVE